MKQKQTEKGKTLAAVPIRARYVVDRKTGEIVSREYETADIPAAALAEFFLQRFGIDAEEVGANG